MTLEERIAQADALRARNTVIDRYASESFEVLWTEITEITSEAKIKRFPELLTRGAVGCGRKEIILPIVSPSKETYVAPRTVTLNLDRNTRTISAVGNTGTYTTLALDLDENQTVCLIHKEEPVSAKDAAMLIVDRLLFPELQPA